MLITKENNQQIYLCKNIQEKRDENQTLISGLIKNEHIYCCIQMENCRSENSEQSFTIYAENSDQETAGKSFISPSVQKTSTYPSEGSGYT